MKQYWCRLPVPSWASKGPSVRLIHMEDDQEKEIQGQMIQGHHADAVLHRFKCCFRNKWGHMIKAVTKDVYQYITQWQTVYQIHLPHKLKYQRQDTANVFSILKIEFLYWGEKGTGTKCVQITNHSSFFLQNPAAAGIKCFSCITTVWCVDLFSLLVGDLCQRGLCGSRNPTSQDLLKYVKIKAETIYTASHFN